VAAAAVGDDEDVNDDLLARYRDEKDLVEDAILTEFGGDKSKRTSILWQKVMFVDANAVARCCTEDNATKENYEGIKKFHELLRDDKTSVPVICAICYESPNTPLTSGVVKLHINSLGKPQTSNFNTHLKNRMNDCNEHRVFFQSTIKKGKDRSDRSVASANSTATSLVHPAFQEWSNLPKSQVITRIHQLLYLVINDANIPAHIVRNPRLWDLIEFIVLNGNVLKGTPRNILTMGRHKFNTIQAVSFAEMVSTIERLIEENRKYFKTLTSRSVPFLYVGHDLWDGKNKNVLGLCLFMVSPVLKRMIAFPVGLLRSRAKKAVQVAKQSLAALKRYVVVLLLF
jgi:hypothetical protein